MKFGIVILNYLNYQDTIDCVNSLLIDISELNIPIVIVDNNSNNDSIDKLKAVFASIDNIDILKTVNNLGYAKGNNIGIYHLKYKYDIRNALILNNDTVNLDSNFINYFRYFESKEKCIGAIGTEIIGRDGKNQNPVSKSNNLISSIKFFVWLSLKNKKIYTQIKSKKNLKNKNTANRKTEGFYLHGSAILLTEHYLKLFGGFYAGTFLYYEENILDYLIKKNNLEFHYEPEIFIYHKEDMSSAASFANLENKKFKFIKNSVIKYWILRILPSKFVGFLNKKNIEKNYFQINYLSRKF